jgi:hypothetical protein
MNPVKQYLADIGSKGGQSKSRAKLSAARANGKLGGRPKKPKRAARLPNDQAEARRK